MSETFYLLESTVDYEGAMVRGLFSTRTLAMKAADALGRPDCDDYGQRVTAMNVDADIAQVWRRHADNGEWSMWEARP